jgi:hypothetical protein
MFAPLNGIMQYTECYNGFVYLDGSMEGRRNWLQFACVADQEDRKEVEEEQRRNLKGTHAYVAGLL